MEESHWWYVGLRDLARSVLTPSLRAGADVALLDAGCGTGKFLEDCGVRRTFGLERSGEAFRFLRLRALPRLTRGSVRHVPYADDSFDLVVSMDVLCCVPAPGDLGALRELARVLRPGGLLLLNLPAYEWLRSHHDAAVHTRQRYSRARVREMLGLAGLEQVILTYRNSLLFPVAAAVRLVQRASAPALKDVHSDLKPLPSLLNRLLVLPLRLETIWVRAGFAFPFGLSVFCVAQKPLRAPSCTTKTLETSP